MKHMTQAELARAAGVSQSAIASYESQQRLSSRATFKLAAILKVDPGWLHTGKGSMQPAPPIRPTPPVHEHAMREPEMREWPFRSITPTQFDALTSDHKRVFESTVQAFVLACLEQYALDAMKKRQDT